MNRVRPRGFALLLTLLLVVLVAASLAGIARFSMLQAVEAQDAVEALQRRWAVLSAQATLTPRAPLLLEMTERSAQNKRLTGPLPSEWRFTYRLATIDYEFVITAEQAKINVNTMLKNSNAADTSAVIRQLVNRSSSATQGARVQLRPTIMVGMPTQDGATLSELGFYDQLFEHASPQLLLGTSHEPGWAAPVTCWGDGRLDIRRAPPAVIKQACSSFLMPSEIDMLVSLRNADPTASVAQLVLRHTSLNDQQRSNLRELFTDQPSCYGLWIVARDAQRARYFLEIFQATPSSQGRQRGGDHVPEFQIAQRQNFVW